MEMVRELWSFVGARKRFWMLPIVVMMLVFGGLVLVTEGTAIAPFIYSIF